VTWFWFQLAAGRRGRVSFSQQIGRARLQRYLGFAPSHPEPLGKPVTHQLFLLLQASVCNLTARSTSLMPVKVSLLRIAREIGAENSEYRERSWHVNKSMGPHGPQRTVSPLREVALSAYIEGEPREKRQLRLLMLTLVLDGCLAVELTGTDPTRTKQRLALNPDFQI